MARAQRIEQTARALLDATPSEPEQPGWRLKLEAVGREIDATFTKEALPAALQPIRERIAQLFA